MAELIRDYKAGGGDTRDLPKMFLKRFYETVLEAELTDHLGYEKHTKGAREEGNARNGTTAKTITGDFGQVEIKAPRDRNASFEPQILPKGQRRIGALSRFTGVA